MDGNPIDACSFASYIALQKLRIPKTELTIAKNQISQHLQDFEIISDYSAVLIMDFANIPIFMTVAKVMDAPFLFSHNMLLKLFLFPVFTIHFRLAKLLCWTPSMTNKTPPVRC
jgi:exosome complex RNA-binding protein Rrp42 (RNase PH superfamily)